MSFADLLGTYKAIKEKQQDDASSSDSNIDGPNARPSSKRGPPLEEFARMRKRQDKKRTIRHFSATGSGRGDARAPVRHPKPAASGKLALMFIIIDELPHEAVWRRWLQHGQEEAETRDESTLWDHWLVLLAFFALLTVEWTIRKLNGLP